MIFFFFFFNDTATTEIYTLSLHDALPISPYRSPQESLDARPSRRRLGGGLFFEARRTRRRSEEHTSELQSQSNLVCRLLLEKKKKQNRHLQRDSSDLPRVHSILRQMRQHN